MSGDKLQDMSLDSRNRSHHPFLRIEEQEALVPDYVKRLSQKASLSGPFTRSTFANIPTAISTHISSVLSVVTSIRSGP